jgi:trehalose/maltose hydrolase-like predicted phosphorylase
LYTLVSAAGFPLRAGDVYTAAHEQSLNFRYGIYSRRTGWRLPGASDGILTVQAERYAHIADVHLLCARYTISADVPCRVVFTTGINCAVRDLNGPHLGNFCCTQSQSAAWRLLGVSCETLEQRIPLAAASVCAPDGGAAEQRLCETSENADGIFSGYTIDLDGQNGVSLCVYGAMYTGLDVPDSMGASQSQLTSAVTEGWDGLLLRHRSRWDRIWRTGDVVIEGDDYAQRCLRYSLYHLWITAPRHCAPGGRALSVPARGLSGQTYKGAVFWDTEMFIAPYFLAVAPELAAQFIRYRIQTLPGAKRKAAEYGYRGAFFAWESQESGDDACSDCNVTDVFTGRPVRTYFRDKQIHISADIVYSIKQYVDYTGDFSILREGGMELILEAARFFLSYLYYSPERRRYEALDVIGPDEYHERVNNNAFTNKMIFAVFETAKTYINVCNNIDSVFMESLIKRIGFNDDRAFMETVMRQFYLPQPDSRGVIEQFDGYFRLEDCSLDTARSRLKDPREYWGGGNGVAGTTQIIKQADVVTMLALFGKDYTDAVKKANLAYYEPRTEHGSSLSACMYALLSCETGGSDRAYPFFINSAEIDITGKAKQFAGLVYIGGTHPAANGGAWLVAVKGFCGFSVENGEIHIKPRLPAPWQRVTFTAVLNGAEYGITVTKDTYTICKK